MHMRGWRRDSRITGSPQQDGQPVHPITPGATQMTTRHSPLSTFHALSFDIEDWFHIVEVAAVDNPAEWPALSARSSLVERYTDLILKLCDDANTTATFYILGWIAEHHPDLVRRIADAGHEIGTHSFWHRKVYELDEETFAKDIRDSIDAITAAAPGVEVKSFRAPSFSIIEGTEWALDVLLDLGIEHDASLFPARRGHGGYPCPRAIHQITTPKGRTLWEIPMSVMDLGPRKVCYCGGGYLRLLPLSLIERGIAQQARAGRPTVVYLHPRDFAPDCPRVPMPMHRRFKCYVGMRSTEGKLRRLLDRYAWGTCADVIRKDHESDPLRG